MKMKFGAIVVAGSGKIGGHVAAKNRHGAYLRTKVSPTNPKTSFQQAVRARLTSIAQAWRALTAAQISAWNAAVKDYARTDIFGDLRNPSGFNLYQKLNSNLSNVGEANITNPPLPAEVGSFTAMSASAAKAVPTLSLVFAPVIDANMSVLVDATPGISAGRNFVKSQYRQIAVMTSADVTPMNLLAAYTAKFGSIPAAGEKIFIRAKQINNTTGQAGQTVECSCIVAA